MSYYLLSFSKLLVELLISRQDSLLDFWRVCCKNSWQAATFKKLLVIVAILLVFDSFFPTPDDFTAFGGAEAFEALGFAKSFVSYWIIAAWHCTSFQLVTSSSSRYPPFLSAIQVLLIASSFPK